MKLNQIPILYTVHKTALNLKITRIFVKYNFNKLDFTLYYSDFKNNHLPIA